MTTLRLHQATHRERKSAETELSVLSRADNRLGGSLRGRSRGARLPSSEKAPQARHRNRVSISSAIRWTALLRSTGSVRPQPVGGDQRSGRIEACAPVILQAVEDKPDIPFMELRTLLAERVIARGARPPWRLESPPSTAATTDHADPPKAPWPCMQAYSPARTLNQTRASAKSPTGSGRSETALGF